jgi:hypothetical protein
MEIYRRNIFPIFEDFIELLFTIFTRKKISLILKCQVSTLRIIGGLPDVKYALGWN